MCNLSDWVEGRGIEKGKSEMVLKMLKTNHSVKVISEISDFPKKKIKDIAKEHGITIKA